MRSIPLFAPVFAFTVAFAAYGCTLDVSGADPATSSAGGAGPGSSTVAGPGSTVTSAGTSAGGGGGVTSSASSASTGCASTIEDCTNGVDDTCDGLIDCADPQCSGPADGRACVEPPPQGWTLVAFQPDASAACPTGSTEIAQVAEAPTSADAHCTCECDCTGSPKNNPCVHGTITGAVIGMNCTAKTLNLVVSGGCDPLGQTFPMQYNTINAKPLNVTPIDVVGKGILPGVQPGASGLTCSPDASTAGGCTSGGTCLPKTTAAALCIQMSGDVPCPAGPLSKRRVVGVPGAVNDGRTCAACSCASSAASCANPTFSGFSVDDCSSGAAPASVVEGACKQAPSGNWDNADHFVYSATPVSPTCALKGGQPDVLGTLTPQGAITICCAP